MISSSHRPSRYGDVATAASSSPITSSPSRSRAAKLGLHEPQPRLLEPGPVRRGPVAGRGQHVAAEERQSARRSAAAAPAWSPASKQRGRRVDVAQHPERVDGGGLDREPVAVVAAGEQRRVAEAAAQPGDLRLQRVAVASASPAHRSSSSRSARTGVPASSARRTSSSAVLPPGIATGSPSRLTSTGPSTENSSTGRVRGFAKR